MPSYEFVEIQMDDEFFASIDYERGLWNDDMEMYDWIQWDAIKCVARRFLTPRQFCIYMMSGKHGMTQSQIAKILGITRSGVGDILNRGVKRLRKAMRGYLHYWDTNRRYGYMSLTIKEKVIKGEVKCPFCKKKISEGVLDNGKLVHEKCIKKHTSGSKKKIFLGI